MNAPSPLWAQSYAPGVPLTVDYAGRTVVDVFEDGLEEFAERPAFDFLGRVTDYRTVADQVLRVAGALRRMGVKAGDNVALVMPNCPQNVVAFLAVVRLGATVVEHNPLYTAAELRGPFVDHGATVAIVWDKVVGVVESLRGSTALRDVVAVDMTAELPLLKRVALRLPIAKARESRDALTGPAPDAIPWSTLLKGEPLGAAHPRPAEDDVALLLYTSGTTGTPKGVPLRHRNLIANVIQGQHWVSGMVPGQESVMVCLPLFHAYGVTVSVLLGLSVKAKLVLLPKPEIGLVMDAIKRDVPSFLPAVPPLYRRIADASVERGISIKGVRYALSGAMPLSAELVEQWESLTGGVLCEGYGLTETSPVIVGNPMSKGRRPGSIGVPFPDTEVRIVDREDLDHDVALGERGELLVKGPQVFDGYKDLPEETAKAFHDGWFRTGDVVTMAEDGFITVVDRIKEVVITGGFNVYPSEVEAVLREHPAVADAAVVGLTGPDGSEQVVAAVVPEFGVEITGADLKTFCREALTPYKVPRRFFVVEELPLNAMGKVLRREVVEMIRDL
ncbi:long-chain-fatty-acid--CoA ligase [Nocardioides yefusunii]|uniref:Long-chain-fatty-acid--CoA ligase n=1 Tax=Nocardioides yefusunii TaxID=2500546 RepID=A0ABW1QXP9_9ACTN|nr:long-chain-fatty-acid--CoA ligase [Nocardioides yefusunii]